MKKIEIICDYQENFESKSSNGHINDHQTMETFTEIEKSIKSLGYECAIFGGVPELLKAEKLKINSKDKIFLNLSDGLNHQYSRVQIPILCDILGLNYSGGNPFTVALTSNKFYTKLAVEKMGIPIPEGILVTANNIPDERTIKTIAYPVIIKPNCEGSSVGIDSSSICHNLQELVHKMHEMLNIYTEIIIEKFISGYDVTNFIIGNSGDFRLNQTLVALRDNELINNETVMSIDDYLNKKNSYENAIDHISDLTNNMIRSYSESIVTQLNVFDIARIDYKVTTSGEIYFLEVNTVPAIHKRTQAGAVCKILDISFDRFLDKFITAVANRLKV